MSKQGKTRFWYWRPAGYCYGIGPIQASSKRKARKLFREWMNVNHLQGEVWEE